jgi:hypothetical protein
MKTLTSNADEWWEGQHDQSRPLPAPGTGIECGRLDTRMR